MAKRVYCDFYDLTGALWTVEIHDTSFSSTATTIKMGGTPVVIRWSGDNLKHIVGSEATLTLVSTTDLSWLYTNDGTKLQVYIKLAGTTVWQGFVLPDQYFKQLAPTMTFTVQVTDRLGILSTIDYSDGSGLAYEGYDDDILILSKALLKTWLSLPIRSFVNLFEDTMNDTDADDPLAQAQTDQESITGDDQLPGTAYDMIAQVLNGYQARIFQDEGYWCVQRFKELSASDNDYRDFDSAGAYVTNGTKTIAKDFDKASFMMLAGSQMEIYPGYRKLTITQNFLKRSSLFRGHTFPEREFVTATDLRHWTIEATSDWQRAQSGDNYLLKCGNVATLDSAKYIESDKIAVTSGSETYTLSLKYGMLAATGYLNFQLFLDAGGGTIYTYDENLGWTLVDQLLWIYSKKTGIENLDDWSIPIEALPANGDLWIRFYDGVSTTSNTFYIDDIVFQASNETVNHPDTEVEEVAIDAENNVDAAYLMTSCSYTGKNNELLIYRAIKKIKASGLPATTWYLKGAPGTLLSLDGWVKNNSATNATGSYGFRGSVYGSANYWNVYDIIQISNQRFIPLDIELDVKRQIWSGNAIESKGILTPLDQTTRSDNGRGEKTTTITTTTGGGGGGGGTTVDNYRAGSVAVSAGDNTITFSSAHPAGTAYTLRAFVVNADGDEIGKTITSRTAAGFDINVDEGGTLEYEAITIK